VRSLKALAALAVLSPAFGQVQVMDPLTVSATRAPEPQSQVPFTVEVLPADAFADGAAPTGGDALRGLADFSLFRRNDSVTANPTSQGVSLRGLGPSGASRSLVLLDGVPLNDPFGGWVPWSSVPVDSLGGAEVVPGGGASAWGNEALSGVIQLFSARPLPGEGAFAVDVADFGTRSAEVSQAVTAGPGTLEIRGQDFATDGIVLVAPEGRGPIDVAAASRHNLESARWSGDIGDGVTATVTLRRFEEWRDNGTPYQQNGLRQLLASVTLSGRATPGEAWSATAYLQGQSSWQTFSSVNSTRSSETPASDQFDVPATAAGIAGSSTWRDAAGASTTVGADIRDVRGETREDFLYSRGAYTEQRFAGGRQTLAGLFAERSQPLGADAHATAGVRLDRSEDSDGHLRNVALSTGALLQGDAYPTRTGTELSPGAGIAWQAARELELHLSGQRAFRQPTLNELYRPFRQGTTTTLSNPELSTEHADSAEIGATWKHGGLSATATAFAARLDDAVANVTLAQGPGTFPLFGALAAGAVGQERLNLGRVDTRGLQLGVDWKLSDTLSLELSAIDEEATVGAASVAPGLVGKTLPEVPRTSASLGLAWRPTQRLQIEGRVRRTGSQFDDDQNLLPLAAATVADVSLRLRLTERAELFAGAQNLGSARVETAHSALGVYNLAPPRTAGAGARLNW